MCSNIQKGCKLGRGSSFHVINGSCGSNEGNWWDPPTDEIVSDWRDRSWFVGPTNPLSACCRVPHFHSFTFSLSPPPFGFILFFFRVPFWMASGEMGPACYNYGLNIWILSLLWWPNLYLPIVSVFLSGLLLWCYSLQFLFCTSL